MRVNSGITWAFAYDQSVLPQMRPETSIKKTLDWLDVS